MMERWEVTIVDKETDREFTSVEEVSTPMAQASAEVQAIKRHVAAGREHVRCTNSRFLGIYEK